MMENPETNLTDPSAGEAAPRHRRFLGRFRRRTPRRRILRSTAALPALFTIGNGLAGFAAIHFATKDGMGAATLWNLGVAAVLLFIAMTCDMLDGRLARLTRRTSDFGAQLDSLCDAISFGVAPAVLMVRTVAVAFSGQIARVAFLPEARSLGQVIWCIGGLYMACAVLRLARFNVENEPDKSSHMDFRGLPTPGAAAPIAALALLFARLAPIEQGWRSSPFLLVVVTVALPVVTLFVALLMVSRFRYAHVVNQYIRGRRPFSYLVKLVVIVLAGLMDLFITAGVVTVGYALSGPVQWVWRKVRPRNPDG